MTQTIEHVTLWRALLELAQISQAVLEREIPEGLRIPQRGLAILRLLRWGGPLNEPEITQHLQSGWPRDAIDAFAAQDSDLVAALCEQGLVEPCGTAADEGASYQLTPQGGGVIRQVVTRQREVIWRVLDYVDEQHRPLLGRMLEQLARGLTEVSQDFGITCAQCWAYDMTECPRRESHGHCTFRQAGRAQIEPTTAGVSSP